MVTAAETITNAGGGNDRVTGSDGTDTLYGGDGADIIYAGTGDDIIYGNAGDDILYGEAGADTFHYTRGDGNDLLADFDQSDVIEYHGYSEAEKSLFSESIDADGNTVITLIDGASITKLSQGNNAPTGTINISGDIKQGATISAVTTLLSDADGVGALNYQWFADGVAISNATGDQYTLTQTDVGKSISLKVNYIDGLGNSEEVTSSSSSAVANLNDPPVLITSSSLTTNENTASAAIAFSASDIDGDNLTFTFSDPAKGTITNNNDGTYTYTPDVNESGSDSFTVTVNDGSADASQTVNVKINTVTNIPVLHYDISGDAPQFIGLENLEVISFGDPEFSYSYNNISDTTDVTDLEFSGDLQNVSFKFLDTEIPLFDTSGGLPPLDTGIVRYTNESLETIDILWAHAHPTNSSLSYTEDADYLGSFMLLLDQELPDISNQEEFMEYASSVGLDVVQIPDSVVYGPGNSDWLFRSYPVDVASRGIELTLGGKALNHGTIHAELDSDLVQVSSETGYFDLQGSSIGTITLDSSMHTSDINISDVISSLRCIVGLDTLSGKGALAADVNNDTKIEIDDVISQLRHIVGLEEINTFDVVDAAGKEVGNTLGDQTSIELILNGDVDLSTTLVNDFI